MIHDEILDEASTDMLDVFVGLLWSDTPSSQDLAPEVFDWFAVYREWQALGLHLLRTADGLFWEARLAASTKPHEQGLQPEG